MSADLKGNVMDDSLNYKAKKKPSDKWWAIGAFLFLVILAIQGMPLDGKLGATRMLAAGENFDAVQMRSGEIGIQETYVVALVWGGAYAVAFLLIAFKGQLSFLYAIKRFSPYFALLALSALSVIWSYTPTDVVMLSLHMAGVTAVTFSAAMYYYKKKLCFLNHSSIVLGINTLIHFIASLVVPALTTFYDGRSMGLTSNPNTLALIATMSVQVNLFSYYFSSGRMKLVNFIIGSISLATAILAGSATAMISLLFSLILGFLFIKSSFIKKNIIFLVLFLSPIFFIGVYFFLPVFLEWFLPVIGKSSTLSGRTEIWLKGMEAFSIKPILGWGFDDRGEVAKRVFLTTVHFHNGYIDTLVRGGMVGGALLLFMLYKTIKFFKNSRSKMAAYALSFLSMFLIYNFSEVSMMTPRNITWIMLSFLAFLFLKRNANGLVR